MSRNTADVDDADGADGVDGANGADDADDVAVSADGVDCAGDSRQTPRTFAHIANELTRRDFQVMAKHLTENGLPVGRVERLDRLYGYLRCAASLAKSQPL